MKALVTGAAGFVGRHMVRALCSRGWMVDGVDVREHDGDPTTGGGWYCHGVLDALEAFRNGWPTPPYDLVVHAAAAEPHRAAIDGKPMLLAANLQLDAAMFDWAVRTGTRVLYLSSSAAYPVSLQQLPSEDWRRWHPGYRLREADTDPALAASDNLGESYVFEPDATYGWAKLTGERLAAAAAESGLPVHVVRPFSGYGEDQSLDFPFPSIVARARTGDLSVWGTPGQTRDWIHISDLVAGALAVVDADERRPVNLCTGVGTEMGDLARLVAKLAGVDGEVVYQPDRPTGVMFRVGDPSRMNEHYTARVSIEEGVRRALGAS